MKEEEIMQNERKRDIRIKIIKTQLKLVRKIIDEKDIFIGFNEDDLDKLSQAIGKVIETKTILKKLTETTE